MYDCVSVVSTRELSNPNWDRTRCPEEYIHVKLEKFKRGRSPSLDLGKEGDFARNHFATFISSINIQIPAESLKMMRYSLI